MCTYTYKDMPCPRIMMWHYLSSVIILYLTSLLETEHFSLQDLVYKVCIVEHSRYSTDIWEGEEWIHTFVLILHCWKYTTRIRFCLAGEEHENAWEGNSFSICIKGRTGQEADTRGWKKKNQPETKNVPVGSPPAQIRWTVKPIPAHISIEILSFQRAFPPILSHLILTTTLWERESSFPVVETEALRERRFAGNWSSQETVICSFWIAETKSRSGDSKLLYV